MTKILVVDDEEKICFAFDKFLRLRGHQPLIASTGTAALQIVREQKPRIVFLDIRLPGVSGLDVLEEIKREDSDIAVVVMTAYGTMDHAIRAMRQGAYEYLSKPIDLDQVGQLLERILQARDIRPLSMDERAEASAKDQGREIIGRSQAIQDIYKMIGLLTTNDVPVLIEGESGVGKELVAQAIHYKSDRKNHRFVAINCGAMPENLLETELFGYEKGAYTGAESQKLGKIEYAGQGTVFLDEIAELKFPLQIKLLRVLQERQIVRVGGLEPIVVQARVIAATNKTLADEVSHGNFRSDLFYRLQLITLTIPPLRERREDIPELVEYFIHRANRDLKKAIQGIEQTALERLTNHSWPGNVRELENTIKRACILARGDTLELDLFDDLQAAEEKSMARSFSVKAVEQAASQWFRFLASNGLPGQRSIYTEIMDAVERTLIRDALRISDGNQLKAAQMLGMNRNTLRKKMADYQLK